MESYDRKARFTKLKPYCIFASDEDFIEICEWKNGEGIDVTLNNKNIFSLTYGELEALIVLAKIR
jgi:hypothetical protein